MYFSWICVKMYLYLTDRQNYLKTGLRFKFEIVYFII